ncbi:MAG: hypothetical protein GY773_33915 [Actinomycetia bacterium]|nr:hypothetical protein [Actinomycetes bacterium]
MHDGTRDEVSVSFHASPDFSRIGRVAVAGLAMRLGVDIADVEKLRLAVDHSVEALHGRGRISLHARWEPSQLVIVIDNPDEEIDEAASVDVSAALATMVDEVEVSQSEIHLTLANQNGRGPVS